MEAGFAPGRIRPIRSNGYRSQISRNVVACLDSVYLGRRGDDGETAARRGPAALACDPFLCPSYQFAVFSPSLRVAAA